MQKWEVVNPNGYESVSITEDGKHVGTWIPEIKAQEIARKLNAFDEMLEALKFVKKEWQHTAPSDCYSTGPCTGDPIRDHVSCPGCATQGTIDAAIALAEAANA
jgi:hypothetical protein